MLCRLVLLVALVQQASAEVSANDKHMSQMPALPKKDTTSESDANEAPLAPTAPEREATDGYDTPPGGQPYATPYNAHPTTIPWQKIAGPVVAGVAGTAALAGVIAVSVMKNKESTTIAPPPRLRAKEAVVTTLPPTTTTVVAEDSFASSGLTQTTTLVIACTLVGCAVCILVGICLKMLSGKKKRGKAKAAPPPSVVVPEDQQPMMPNRMDDAKQKWASELDNQSQYMPVETAMQVPPLVPAMTPSYSYSGGMPTMTNVVPMQTMPPPPPPPVQYTSTMPTSGYMQMQPAGIQMMPSPLANTVTNMPAAYSVAPPRFA